MTIKNQEHLRHVENFILLWILEHETMKREYYRWELSILIVELQARGFWISLFLNE